MGRGHVRLQSKFLSDKTLKKLSEKAVHPQCKRPEKTIQPAGLQLRHLECVVASEKKKEKKVELRVKVISLNEVLSITSVGS